MRPSPRRRRSATRSGAPHFTKRCSARIKRSRPSSFFSSVSRSPPTPRRSRGLSSASLPATTAMRGLPSTDRGAAALLRVLGSAVLTLLGLLLATFLIARVVPIDPVLAILGDRASAESYARVHRELGLDQ